MSFKCLLLFWLCLRARCMSKFVWTLSRGVNSIGIMIWTEFRSELIWAAFISVNWIKIMIWTEFRSELIWAAFISVNSTRFRSGLSLHLNRGTSWYLNGLILHISFGRSSPPIRFTVFSNELGQSPGHLRGLWSLLVTIHTFQSLLWWVTGHRVAHS